MENLIKELLNERNIALNRIVDNTISKLEDNAKLTALVKDIAGIKNQIIEIFNMYKEKEEFKESQVIIANANAKKEYDFTINLDSFPNIVITEIRNLDSIGLQFDANSNRISGIPMTANSVDLQIVFYSKMDENKVTDLKIIPFIVNADPKDLWLNKASDQNAKYPKPDEEKYKSTFLDKKIVVASKRGRSHAHEGSFRDDHFLIKTLTDGWEIAIVSDGAGSAKYSRQGSKVAVEILANRLENNELIHSLSSSVESFFNVSQICKQEQGDYAEQEELKYKSTIVNLLYKEVLGMHKQLIEFADQEGILLKDLNTTLIFALCKKLSIGYVILTFGVGDCPINILHHNHQEVKLLNILDVGEFGGGTRFITMPEIFTKEIAGRFSINLFDKFDKLFLMTDGIYDPKFVTENKLEDKEVWVNFIKDLNGENEENLKVDFNNDDNIDDQLLSWMDFWSKGNHDDRTLAIIY